MYTRAHDIRLGETEVYTHTRVVIRLYYIDREKKKSRTRACEGNESERRENVRV